MTQLEKKQEELINLLKDQLQDISIMSKIELGDDVVKEIVSLNKDIESLTTTPQIPFISEVEEFNNAMGKSWQNRTTPTINKADAQFVIDFIQEELDELKEAVQDNNIVEVFDALLDIAYVGLGNGALVFGLKDKMEKGYAEVQASNLSKICKTEEEAIKTVKVRSEQQSEPCHFEEVGNGFVVYRSRDMKVMKALSYFSPNLSQFFTPEEINQVVTNLNK